MHTSKKDQIEALLRATAFELVKEQYGSAHSDAYSEVFTVTRQDILDYLRATYRLGALVRFRPADDDGFYAIPSAPGFSVFEQYSNVRTGSVSARSEDEVWPRFVDYIIRTSGTGLKFE